MADFQKKLLDIRDLTVQFDTDSGVVHAVNHLNMQLEEGKALGFVGETGAGKTTTALAILQLIQSPPGEITSGEIWFKGQNVREMTEAELRNMRGREIAMIYQDALSSLNPSMLIKAQMKQLTKRGGTRTAEELLELVEMEVRELLSKYEFPGDDLPVIKGSALNALTCESDDPNAPEYACIKELMDAVDSYIPTPPRDDSLPFLMPVEDVFTISGRGTVATGRVERGELKLNDPVEIVGIKDTQSTVATGIEMFRKMMDKCEAGDNVGILLRGIKREEIQRGQVLCKPGSVTPHTKFTGEIYVLTKEEGGRHTPFFDGYRPQFYFRTTDVTGSVKLPEGTEMAMPGDHITIEGDLIHPIAMEEGLRFAIREGGHTVGSGIVSTIIE